MNKYYVVGQIGTLTRRHLAIAALAAALGALASCNGDNSTPNLPPIIPVPNSIVVADVGNGAPDLLVATTADEGYAQNPGYADIILNTPGSLGTFKQGVHYSTTGTNPSSIAAADFTGSGGLAWPPRHPGTGIDGALSLGISTPGTPQRPGIGSAVGCPFQG